MLVTLIQDQIGISKNDRVLWLSIVLNNLNNPNIVLNSRTTNDFKDIKTINKAINITRFSSLKKLIMVTGYIKRSVNNLDGTLKNRKLIFISGNTLIIDE